ncbi:MAG TPA: PspC domain-containing protein [Ilumatobacteraceae bacterium]
MTTGTATIDPEPTDGDPMTDQHQQASEGLPPPFAPPPPPPPPSTPWYRVRVARDQPHKKIGGVVAGISRAYGFDVKTTRIAVAISALIFPAVIIAYLAALILLPDRIEDSVPLRDIVTNRRRLPLAIVLGVVIALAAFGSLGTWFVFGGFGWGFALIALGVVLWAAPHLGTRTPAPPPPPVMPMATTATGERTATLPPPSMSAEAPEAMPGTVTTVDGAMPPDVTAPRRRRFPIGAISFLVASTLGIVAAVGDAFDWWNTDIFGVTMAILGILAVGAIASSIFNRSWLVGIVAVPIMGVMVSLAIVHPNLNGGVGERTFRPVTTGELSQAQHLGVGRLTVDLTDVPLGTATVDASAEVGMGLLRVVVPEDAELVIDSHVGAGVVTLDDEELAAGFRHDDERTVVPSSASEGQHGTIMLDLDVGAGQIAIERTP